MDRKKLIALAHLAARRAGCVDEDDRRAVQQMVTGVASCREMDEAALIQMIRHWNRLGARVRLPASAARATASDRAPLIAKIAAQCAAGGYPFPAYALGILQHMGCAVDAIEWAPAPMLRKVVAALAYDARRKGRG